MTRNRYDDAFGVAEIEWQTGRPTQYQSPVLVEVWRVRINAGTSYTNPLRPTIGIEARVEVWVNVSGNWLSVGSDGELQREDVGSGTHDVRRWAQLPWRDWSGVATLDGWRA